MTQNRGQRPPITDDARYRILVEAVSDYAIYMLDPDGTVTSWNAGAQRFKGYTPVEIIGHHYGKFYTPEDQRAALPQRNLAIAEREGRFEGEGWRARKDGTRFWAHVVIDAIREPGGELIGFAKITRDLTERRKQEQALRESEERFGRLVQGVTDYAIYMLDPNGIVSNWNAGAERIKGYRAEEIVGQHFSRFYTDEDRNAGEPNRALMIAAADGRFEKEGWRLRKDGSRFWASVIIDPIRDDDGALIGYAKITRDVTERKNAQRALDEAREALFQSQKLEAIGQLTGGVAHDFNNVLMAILSSLELVRKRLPNEPRLLALIDNAVQGAQRGAALTKRMLAFARRQELTMVAIDIPDMVRGMTEMLERSLGPSIAIETRFPLSLSMAQGDANQLELALLNLAVNARDAMPKGGHLIISARDEVVGPGHTSKLEPGAYVCMSVIDAGEGMDADTLARATEPFFTTKGAGKGTGLGLSMVHGVSEQSGGRLILKSTAGQGTTAELWLRAAKTPAVAVEAAPVVQIPTTAALTILAVDDDALILMNTSAMLEDLGHRVFTASSGREALEIMAKQPVDLLITDQAMPGMTGYQLAEAVRERHPKMPIILASGYAELPPGANLVLHRLAKPFWQSELAEVLANAMESGGKRAAVSAA